MTWFIIIIIKNKLLDEKNNSKAYKYFLLSYTSYNLSTLLCSINFIIVISLSTFNAHINYY